MVQNIIFGIMMVIAVGAGVVTAVYEFGGSGKKNTDGEASENGKKEGLN